MNPNRRYRRGAGRDFNASPAYKWDEVTVLIACYDREEQNIVVASREQDNFPASMKKNGRIDVHDLVSIRVTKRPSKGQSDHPEVKLMSDFSAFVEVRVNKRHEPAIQFSALDMIDEETGELDLSAVHDRCDDLVALVEGLRSCLVEKITTEYNQAHLKKLKNGEINLDDKQHAA